MARQPERLPLWREASPLAPPRLPCSTSVAVRHVFIRKVYGILGSQLLLVTALASIGLRLGEHMDTTNPGLVRVFIMVSFLLSLNMMCSFMCYPRITREVPQNYLVLFVFTLSMSLLAGLLSVRYNSAAGIVGCGTTAGIVLFLALFARQHQVEFTGKVPYLLCVGLALLSFATTLWAMGWKSSPTCSVKQLSYATGGSVAVLMYIVGDTQRIVEGKHQQDFGVNDYGMAVFNLYIDVVRLLLSPLLAAAAPRK